MRATAWAPVLVLLATLVSACGGSDPGAASSFTGCVAAVRPQKGHYELELDRWSKAGKEVFKRAENGAGNLVLKCPAWDCGRVRAGHCVELLCWPDPLATDWPECRLLAVAK